MDKTTITRETVEEVMARCHDFLTSLSQTQMNWEDPEAVKTAIRDFHQQLSCIIELANKHGIVCQKTMQDAAIFIGPIKEIFIHGAKNEYAKITNENGRTFKKPLAHFKQAAQHVLRRAENILHPERDTFAPYGSLDYQSPTLAE